MVAHPARWRRRRRFGGGPVRGTAAGRRTSDSGAGRSGGPRWGRRRRPAGLDRRVSTGSDDSTGQCGDVLGRQGRRWAAEGRPGSTRRGHESAGAHGRAAAGDLGHPHHASGSRDLEPPAGARCRDVEGRGAVTGVNDHLDTISLHGAAPQVSPGPTVGRSPAATGGGREGPRRRVASAATGSPLGGRIVDCRTTNRRDPAAGRPAGGRIVDRAATRRPRSAGIVASQSIGGSARASVCTRLARLVCNPGARRDGMPADPEGTVAH